jgi:ribosome-associated protein
MNIEFKLKEGNEESAFIELNKLLKATQICSSGAMANHYITDGLVKLNGNVDTRKRAKIRRGDSVVVEKTTIIVL